MDIIKFHPTWITPGVYGIKNTKSYKMYIGESVLPFARISNHISQLLRNKHECKFFQDDFNNHTLEDYGFFIIKNEINYIKRLRLEKQYSLEYKDYLYSDHHVKSAYDRILDKKRKWANDKMQVSVVDPHVSLSKKELLQIELAEKEKIKFIKPPKYKKDKLRLTDDKLEYIQQLIDKKFPTKKIYELFRAAYGGRFPFSFIKQVIEDLILAKTIIVEEMLDDDKLDLEDEKLADLNFLQ